jgi:hypothetical protein
MLKKSPLSGAYITEHDHLNHNVLVLTGTWQSDFVKLFKKNKVNGIRLSHSAGWKNAPLDFIVQLENLHSFELYNAETKDISILNTQPQLQHISLACPFKKTDFSTFKDLVIFMSSWRRGCESVLELKQLYYINMSAYPYEDLTPLNPLKNLKRLYLQSRKLAALNGIELLPQLSQLQLSYCSNLADISKVNSSQSIEEVEFYNCKKASHIDTIKQAPSIHSIYVEDAGKVISWKN